MKVSKRTLRLFMGLLLIFPSLAFLAIFYYYPIFYSVWMSILKWNLLSPIQTFVGLSHYRGLWTDEFFLRTLKNSINFTIGSVSLSMLLGLVLAVSLNTPTRLGGFLRALNFTPYIVAWVSISLLWTWILDPDYGLANTTLSFLHLPSISWLGDPRFALISLILVTVWKTAGYDMVIWLAGLRSIPVEYYEAARIDGATSRSQFLFITLPLLSPTFLFLLVTSAITSFTVFAVVKVMTGGGPVGSTLVFVFYIYQLAFEWFDIGKASAVMMVFFVMIIGLTLLQFYALRARIHYER